MFTVILDRLFNLSNFFSDMVILTWQCVFPILYRQPYILVRSYLIFTLLIGKWQSQLSWQVTDYCTLAYLFFMSLFFSAFFFCIYPQTLYQQCKLPQYIRMDQVFFLFDLFRTYLPELLTYLIYTSYPPCQCTAVNPVIYLYHHLEDFLLLC